MDARVRINRRAALKYGGGGALSAGFVSVAGCSNEGRGAQGSQHQNDAVKLPLYVKYEGVTPDLKGKAGVADAFFTYPAKPVRALDTKPGDGKTISTMGITNTPIPPALSDNKFWQALNKRLGSSLTISLANPSDYTQKFATAVAGDQLPDIFSVGSAPQLPQLLNAKALDLTPYLSGEHVKDYPFLGNIPTESWKSTVFNGRIFGVPIPRGVISTFVLFGREDMLAKQGIQHGPRSWDEFMGICRQVNDPKSNVWALAYIPLDFVRQMWSIPNGWSLEKGTLKSALEDQRQKDALQASRSLVANKLMNPDAFGAPWQDYKTWVANGTAFFTMGSFSGWPGYYQIRAKTKIHVMAYGPYKEDGSGRAPVWLGNPTNSITAINKKSHDRAETLLKVLNWLAAPFGTEEYLFRKYGIEGVDYTLKGTDPILTDKGKSEVQLGLLYLADAPWPIYQPGMRSVTQEDYDAQMSIIPDGVQDPTMGLYSETQFRRGGQINKAIGNLQNDILQGRKPVSAWDDGVQQWKKDGGDKIRDELQKSLEERQGS